MGPREALFVKLLRPLIVIVLAELGRRTICGTTRVGTKISMIYINDIYHDSIIFSSENIMIFLIFSKYQQLLLLFTYFFLIEAYLTQTVHAIASP